MENLDYQKLQEEKEYQQHLVEEAAQRKQWEEEEAQRNAEMEARHEASYWYEDYKRELAENCDEEEYEEKLQSFDEWYKEYCK